MKKNFSLKIERRNNFHRKWKKVFPWKKGFPSKDEIEIRMYGETIANGYVSL